jgi:hypothetical protein
VKSRVLVLPGEPSISSAAANAIGPPAKGSANLLAIAASAAAP